MGIKSHREVFTVKSFFPLCTEVQLYHIWLKRWIFTKHFTTRKFYHQNICQKSFYNKNCIPLQSFLQYHPLHLFLHPFLHCQRNCLLLGKTKNSRQTCITHFLNPYIYNSLGWHGCPTASNNKLLSSIKFKH